jgi:hypothetical protein
MTALLFPEPVGKARASNLYMAPRPTPRGDRGTHTVSLGRINALLGSLAFCPRARRAFGNWALEAGVGVRVGLVHLSGVPRSDLDPAPAARLGAARGGARQLSRRGARGGAGRVCHRRTVAWFGSWVWFFGGRLSMHSCFSLLLGALGLAALGCGKSSADVPWTAPFGPWALRVMTRIDSPPPLLEPQG